jgi:hydroxymethylbilane synthase
VARLVLGTRGSALALWQARRVAERLAARHAGLAIETRVIRSEGDLRPDEPLDAVGSRGIFVHRLQQALLSREIDLAVHSLKDLPTTEPAGLVIAAVTERHDPRDALVTRDGGGLFDLPPGTTLGTGSPRRRCQLLHARPDLRVVPIRGNVETRVAKLKSGEFGALVLAQAGLERLAVRGVAVHALDPRVCLPAAGQGALAVEARADDRATRAWVEPLNDVESAVATAAERALMRHLGGGCLAPAAAFAHYESGLLSLEGLVGDERGTCLLVERERGAPAVGEAIGARRAARLLVAGAASILAALRPVQPGAGDGRG